MTDRAYLSWTVLPVLPVFLGFVLLNILNDGTTTLLTNVISGTDHFANALDLRFFNALSTFAAVALFQVVGCVAVAIFAGLQLRDLPDADRQKCLTVFAVSVTLVVILSIAVRQSGFDGALHLGYRTTCAALVQSGVAPHILPRGCQDPGLSHFAWLGLLPYLAGILAAAAASAIVSTAHHRKDLASWAALVEQAFKATAFVLVTSTVSMMLFYHLPLSVVETEGTRALIRDFAQSMTLFWGIIFTLTLLAVFGPAQLLLSRALAADQEVAPDVRETLRERSMQRQATRILTTLSPLLVGSSATVIEMLSGAITG